MNKKVKNAGSLHILLDWGNIRGGEMKKMRGQPTEAKSLSYKNSPKKGSRQREGRKKKFCALLGLPPGLCPIEFFKGRGVLETCP